MYRQLQNSTLFTSVDELNAIALIRKSMQGIKPHPFTIFALVFIDGRYRLPGHLFNNARKTLKTYKINENKFVDHSACLTKPRRKPFIRSTD